MPETFDYRKLLKKYMDRVGSEEGTYFIPRMAHGDERDGFTVAEVGELNRIAAEIDAE